MHIVKSLALALLLLALAGCSTLGTDSYYDDWGPAEFYSEAKAALDSGNYEQAIDLYGKLEARYPYGPYAQQAQLETAYAHFKNNEPASAVAAADRFIKLHPLHENVDYAYYIRGLASFKDGSGFLERLFDQDPAQRDPAAARESFNYFRELVTRFPNSRYSKDAVERMTYLRNNLARYEVQVADYYMRRGAFLAAANRGKYVTENYPRTVAVPEALAIMVEAYTQMGMNDLAIDTQRVLDLNYPGYQRGQEIPAPATANGQQPRE